MGRSAFGALACWSAALLGTGCAAQRISVSLMPPRIASSLSPSVFWREPFNTLHLDQWREVEVRRHTQYQVTEVDGRRCLEARSHDGASILLTPVRFDPDTYQWLSWDWRVDRLVEDEALERKHGSDAAARVYVYFDTHGLPWQKRSVDYVWSATLPVGTVLNSAFSAESKILVVESGAEHLGQWRRVERNLEEDYQRCFGGTLPNVLAIGVMSDTDNTGAEALAYFDDIQISHKPLTVKP